MNTTVKLSVEITFDHNGRYSQEQLEEKAYWLVQPFIDEASVDPKSYGIDDCQISQFDITTNSN